MANEVLKGATNDVYSSSNWPLHTFEMAEFFSNSSKFTIIDSYSSISTPDRYKGDPIDNGSWASSSDIHEDNSWFVIQSEDSLTVQHAALPKWQAKYQCCDNAGFADVSDPTGVKYPEMHGNTDSIYWRFSPYGGWDSADSTPDFDPSNGKLSFENRTMQCGTGTGATSYLWYLVAGDGWICKFSRKNSDAYTFYKWGGFIGDFQPIDSTLQSMPRCIIAATAWSYAKQVTGTSYYDAVCRNVEHARDIGFVDWRDELEMCPFSVAFPYGLNWYPNAHDSRTIELMPYIVVPRLTPDAYYYDEDGYDEQWAYNGPIGTIPALAIGRGVGMQPVHDKEWLSITQYSNTINSMGVYFRWDGTSDLP